VYPLHGIGGLERHVYDLVRHLIAHDVHVTLITKPPTAGSIDALGVPSTRLRFIEVPYVTFPGAGRRGTTVADRISAYPFFGWRAGKVAAKLAYQGEVDVVYALGASGLGYAMARRRHESTKPFVFNPQGLEEFGGTNPEHARLKRIAYGPLQSAVRSCARAADSVIATDRSLVPTLLRHLPIDLAHIDVVPNGIDLDAIDHLQRPAVAELRARAHIPAEASLLVSVGRLEANKGFHVFARALGVLQQRYPQLAANLYWVLAGDGPFRGEIEHAAQVAGVGSRMIIAGRVSDEELHGWYEAADLFVHPTLYEGSSLVTLEAMAHARPVLATRAGGLPDKVTPDENGWLVDPDRPDQLADALAAALQLPPDTRAAMGRASRARVEREFAWPVIADTMIAVYRRLIAAEERV
jgi:glycosyltransferase involved in cell wall biosynthesis